MLGRLKLWAAGGAAVCVLLLANWMQYRAGLRTAAELGQVKAALSLSDAALQQLRTLRADEAALVAESAKVQDKLAAENRGLEKQLREAVRHAKEINPDTVLPDGVADALCLRWRSASGLNAGGEGNPAANAHAGAADSPAALCAPWRGQVTLGDAVEWAGLLLDHAGAERLDKATLRTWAEKAR